MPTTVVGLFATPEQADGVISKIEALGIPRKEVLTLTEPETFEVTGVMSFPRLDFEVAVSRELNRIGATKDESELYLKGLRDGGALVFATGEDEQVDAAGRIMDQHGALATDETSGGTPQFPGVARSNVSSGQTENVQAGRVREHGRGAALFVW